jgi:multisubunit Na+/H+ antiporter MnhG subunit
MSLLMLDLFGSALIVLGFVEWFIESGMLVPESLHFPFYPQVLIAIGIALTLPLVSFLISRAKNSMSSQNKS